MARRDTRERIVEAAFETLRTRGYAGASTRAVAAAGGFNPALIFYYFENLQDLLVTALAESSAAGERGNSPGAHGAQYRCSAAATNRPAL